MLRTPVQEDLSDCSLKKLLEIILSENILENGVTSFPIHEADLNKLTTEGMLALYGVMAALPFVSFSLPDTPRLKLLPAELEAYFIARKVRTRWTKSAEIEECLRIARNVVEQTPTILAVPKTLYMEAAVAWPPRNVGLRPSAPPRKAAHRLSTTALIGELAPCDDRPLAVDVHLSDGVVRGFVHQVDTRDGRHVLEVYLEEDNDVG